MADTVRKGSAPNFCPPEEEGLVLVFEDENGDLVNLEFLGLLLYPEDAAPEEQARYGFFFPVDDGANVGDSGEVVCLEVIELDEEGQPAAFEPLDDDALTREIYAAFARATKDIYRFE
ncbi:MAG: DUF1292 domain-containing protein [Eggerthellaceae bacterium]|nr:DUF1292 domain-containing protein [Eggerthellaceae bacterium]